MRKTKATEGELAPSREVREITGLSGTTLWRLSTGRRKRKGELPFPAPAGYLLGRKMWRRAEVVAWVKAQLEKRPELSPNIAAGDRG